MASQENTSLCFVTWNVNGMKIPEKFSRVLELLSSFSADIVFMQETHVGPDCVTYFEPHCILENREETGKPWKVFFTVHSSESKGVAILIRHSVPFEYICHDEDCSGGYIVLFCRLYGELYTLVNVYNHKWDRKVLTRLKDYLMETAEGVLVVGGDFNTVLDPQVDRSSGKKKTLDYDLNDFTSPLRIADTWSSIHRDTDTENRFTRKQGNSCSRLDMFFLTVNEMGRVCKISTELESISDHYPLLLKLKIQMQTIGKPPTVKEKKKLKKSECSSDRTPGKISGAEIVSAVKSLPATEVHRPVRCDVTNGEQWRSWTETLKTKYNDILRSQQVLTNLKHSDYLIFLEILAKRLNAFNLLEEKYDSVVIVIFDRSPQKIRWSFLQKIFQKLKYNYEETCSKYAAFAPVPDFRILDHLPKTESSSIDLRDLQSGCPLTNAILKLALDDLDLNVKEKATCETTVCYHKQSLTIHTHESTRGKIFELVKKFQEDSGVKLSYK